MNLELKEFKTNAWKNPDMVKWYDQRMHDKQGINRLKNAVEIALCAKLVNSQQILDVGIGTGRASLPLAQHGYQVTGIDSSQAMLEQCAVRAREAAIPITLKTGDVMQLPFAQHQFDTVMGLNVVIHFENTADILREWQRVLKPGGRIVFDLLSKDHYFLAQHIDENSADQQLKQMAITDYRHHLSSRNIVDLANHAGLHIAQIIPYGFFFDTNYWVKAQFEKNYSWKRLLGFLETDDDLLEFLFFIETFFVAQFPLYIAPRLMLAFDNWADPSGNQAWLERQQQFDHTTLLDWSWLQRHSTHFDRAWREQFNTHLQPLRNRVLAFRVFQVLQQTLPNIEIKGLVDEPYLSQFYAWQQQDNLDQALHSFCQNWATELDIDADILTFENIFLPPAFEYELMRQLVSQIHCPVV